MDDGLEIASFVVNVIGAILIPFSIFFLGRINDKKISKINIEHYAKQFIIENIEEEDLFYMSLCELYNVHLYEKQYKKEYPDLKNDFKKYYD